MDLFFLAAEAANVATEAPVAGFDWKNIGVFLGGMLAMKLFSWIAGWVDGKGQKWIDERLGKLQDKVNENSVLSQIQADDALFGIIRDAIPEVLAESSDTLRQAFKDGNYDKIDWKDFGSRLWERTKEQIVGGKNDYLKNSSFEDGKVLGAWVAKKVFARKKAKEDGLVNE